MNFVVSRQAHNEFSTERDLMSIRYPLVFVRLSSSWLRLLPRLPVISILSSVFSNVV